MKHGIRSLTYSLFLSFILITGCTDKEEPTGQSSSCPDPVYPVEGMWVGTYKVDQNSAQPALPYILFVKPGGKLLTESMGGNGVLHYSSGSWTLNGAQFTFNIQTFPASGNIEQSGTLVFSNTGVMSSGTWNDTYNQYGLLSGTYPTMQRVN